MKLAIMQPYFLPYIGYWQLINAVDTFVLFDDVNFINRGWINRNRLLANCNEHLFTIPLEKASQNKKINEISIVDDDKWKTKLLKTIELGYKKSQYFGSIFPIVEEIILNREKNLSNYITHSIKRICSFLNINKTILLSSEIKKNDGLKGQEKILEICKLLYADCYLNLPGGSDLYSKEIFNENNISLKFIKMNAITYNQQIDGFIPNLSFLDVLFFNPENNISEFLKDCTIY